MKKIRNLIMALMIGMMLTSCSSNNTQGSKPVENTNVESVDSTNKDNEEKKEEVVKKAITVEELNAELSKQPMIVIKTEYIVQDAEYKALYPDGLNVIIKNNSGTDIKNAVVGFIAWDENNFPVKIKGQYDYSGGDYYVEVNYKDVNMVNGATYGEDRGYFLDEDNKISKFKAIIVSYTDFDGNTWYNPLLEDFKEIYADKKLVE